MSTNDIPEPTPTQLAQLIDSIKLTNSWSDPDLVRNAAAHGHELTKSNISRVRNELPLISIKGDLIEALAAALGVSANRVATAAISSMGIGTEHHEQPAAERAIALDSTLSARDRRLLLAMLAQMRQPTEP